MSALCGIWYRDGRPGAAAAIARMQAALAIYGPDRAATRDEGEIALGHRLTRLVPEDRFDHQPLADADARFMLVADARIDNRSELASALGIPAERLATRCDAALILAAWCAWGEASIARLYGDFAFALWDVRERTLHLVRDFPGGRPLFYHDAGGWIAFASMAKGLHALPDVPYAADRDTVRNLLGFLPMAGSASFFAGIDRVEPGTRVTIRPDGRRELDRWYTPPRTKLPERADPRDYVAAVRDCFDRAVADRLRANGEVAATLSGGFDSSAVTASAAVQLAATNRRLTAYTHVPMRGVALARSPNGANDEGPLAALLAARYPNIDHVLVDAPGRVIGEDLDARFHYQEMPALNLCNEVWLAEIARLAGARRGTVLLTGLWGNMTISDHGLERMNALLYGGRLVAWQREARALLRRRTMRPGGLAFLSMMPLLTPRLAAAIQRAGGKTTRDPSDFSLLRADAMPASRRDSLPDRYDGTGKIARDRAARAVTLMWQQELVAIAQKGQLARFGVDVRDPTSDRRLIDLCLALPDSMFLRDGQLKWLYRQAFGDRIPEELLHAPGKGLQGADWLSRLNGGRDIVIEEARRVRANADARALFDMDALQALAEAIPAADEAGANTDADYRYKLLRTLSAAHFLRKVAGGND